MKFIFLNDKLGLSGSRCVLVCKKTRPNGSLVLQVADSWTKWCPEVQDAVVQTI